MKKDALLKVIADRLITFENCKEFPQKDTLRIIARFFGTDDLLQKPASPSPALPAGIPPDLDTFDVIQGPPGVTVYVRPDISPEVREMAIRYAVELRQRAKAEGDRK